MDAAESRLKYEMRMGRAPPLNDRMLEDRLREEGARMENEERVYNRDVVGNTISDGLCAVLIFSGVVMNGRSLRVVRQGVYNKFLSLEVSTQAFLLLLVADIMVGYHSSDGWVALLEVVHRRYTMQEMEAAEARARAARVRQQHAATRRGSRLARCLRPGPACRAPSGCLWRPCRWCWMSRSSSGSTSTCGGCRPAPRSSWGRSRGIRNHSPAIIGLSPLVPCPLHHKRSLPLLQGGKWHFPFPSLTEGELERDAGRERARVAARARDR